MKTNGLLAAFTALIFFLLGVLFGVGIVQSADDKILLKTDATNCVEYIDGFFLVNDGSEIIIYEP